MPILEWIGKKAILKHHQEIPFHLLKVVDELSVGDKESGNLLVQADNLLALKALLPYYAGKVNCIYIDPPYNTGEENWVYNDNVNSPEIREWLNKTVGKEGMDLTRHDKWLCMVYPRLQLLNKLLAKEGTLVISISHHEVSNLMIICKEIFIGKQVVCITVQTSGGKPSGGFNIQHEYLVYVTPNNFEPNQLLFAGGKVRSPFEGLTLATFNKTQRPNQVYPIFINKTDGKIVGVGKSLQEKIKLGEYTGELKDYQYSCDDCPDEAVAIWPVTSKGKYCVWRLISSRLLSDWEKGYIKISRNKNKKISNEFSIQYLPIGVIKKIEIRELEILGREENNPTLIFGKNTTVGSQIPTLWLEKEFYTVKGTTALNDIFNKKVFNYPKSLELISEILRSISSKDDLILDSFAGSGTTGHAVIELNNEDEGDRKVIMIEMEKDICREVTYNRMAKVINGYEHTKSRKKEEHAGLKSGLTYCELGDTLFDEQGKIRDSIKFEELAKLVYFLETGHPLEALEFNSPHIGNYNEVAYYLLYNGILGDKSVNGGNVLINPILQSLPEYEGAKVIYGEACRLGTDKLRRLNITFKQIPYDIGVN